MSSTNNIKRNIFFQLLEYLFISITILNYGSVYINLLNSSLSIDIKLLWHIILIGLIFILAIFVKKSLHFSTYFLVFLSLYIILVTLFILINSINYHLSANVFLKYLINPIFISILLYMLYKCSLLNSLFYKFENILIILSIVSLIFWVLSLAGLNPNVSIVAKWGALGGSTQAGLRTIPGYDYLYFIPQGHINFLGVNLIRNADIFMESGIFSNSLVIALLIELFIKRSKGFNWKLLLLFVTIFSTTATSGLLISIPAMFYAWCLKDKRNNVYFILIPIILAILYFVLNSKLNLGSVSSSSVRLDDIHSTIDAWLQHPIIGNGVNNDLSIRNHMAIWRFISGGTVPSVGFTRMLAYGGVLLGIYYIIPVIISFRISYRLFGFSLFIFILFIFNDLTSYMFFMIIMYIWIVWCIYKEKI